MVLKKSQTITAIIPVKERAEATKRCLDSVAFCDKVLILVSPRKNGRDDFVGVQKRINRAIFDCSTDWILRIDSDEEVTRELQIEILKILTKKNDIVAYGVPRKQFFLGGFLTGGDWAYDRLVRLFRPEFAYYEPIVPVHEQFKVNGPVGVLKNPLNHYSHPILDDALKKFYSYTTLEAENLTMPVWLAVVKMFLVPPYVFGRWMIWHQGWRDGFRGLVAGLFRSFYDFLLYSKYLEKKLF